MKKAVISLLLAFLLCLSLFHPALAAEDGGKYAYTPPEEVESRLLALMDGCILGALLSPDSQTVTRSLSMSFESEDAYFSARETVNQVLDILRSQDMAKPKYSISEWKRVISFDHDGVLDITAEGHMPGHHWKSEIHGGSGNHFGGSGSSDPPDYLIEVSFTFHRSEGDYIDRLKQLAAEIGAASETVVGQLEYMNNYLIRNFTYDYASLQTYIFSNSVADFLERGTGVCGSYANTVSYLCFFLGIPCIKLTTYEHEWNCVYVDGSWKMLDVTWNDTENNSKKYFLVVSIGGDMHDWEKYDYPEDVQRGKAFAVELQARIANAAEEAPSLTDEISVTVGGEAVAWTDALPFIDENSRTMVPLRAVGNALGLTVDWDSQAREASFSDGTKTIFFPIGSAEARTGDGETIPMDTAAVIVNDRTYAPIRYLAEFFGHTVDWDGAARTVLID